MTTAHHEVTRTRPARSPGLAPLLAVVLVLVAAACGGDDEGGSSATDPVQGEAVTLEPVGSEGDDPFAASVAIDETADFPDAVAATISQSAGTFEEDASTGGLTTTGATPGLYGGSRDDAVCDVDALTAYLSDPANADKADAFAATLAITTDDLADGFLAALTPVYLTTDTLVTNHGFRDGGANAFPAVLQAGTAVLVDGAGVPRVRCSCGNPLNPPPDEADLDAPAGDPWPGYAASATTTISASADPVAQLTLVDTATGDTFQQSAGTSDGVDTEGMVLAPDGLGVVSLGDPRDAVIAELTNRLGEPDEAGEPPTPSADPLCSPTTCVSTTHVWGPLTVSFGGEGAFIAYRLGRPGTYDCDEAADFCAFSLPPWDPEPWVTELATPEGVSLETSTTDAARAYPEIYVGTCGRGPQPLPFDGATDAPTTGYTDPALVGLLIAQPWDDQVWEIGAAGEFDPVLACDGGGG